MIVTIFKRINQVHTGFFRDVDFVLERIRNGNSKSHVELIRISTDKKDRDNLIGNLSADLGQVKNAEIKQIMLSHFYKADSDYGTRLTTAVKGNLMDVQQRAKKLAD